VQQEDTEAVSLAKLFHCRRLQAEKLLLRNNSLAVHQHTELYQLKALKIGNEPLSIE
jgi:hypothetical protein